MQALLVALSGLMKRAKKYYDVKRSKPLSILKTQATEKPESKPKKKRAKPDEANQ